MTIVQLRSVLDTIARHREAIGRKDEAEGLRRLATALRPADKLAVSKVVEKLRAQPTAK